MSDAPWYFDAVEIDRRAAHAAMHELGFTAMAVAEALALLEADIPLVVEDWRGGARRTFDEQMPGVLEAGHQLVAVLTTAATAVSAALESGDHERQLRADLRAAHVADTGTTDG